MLLQRLASCRPTSLLSTSCRLCSIFLTATSAPFQRPVEQAHQVDELLIMCTDAEQVRGVSTFVDPPEGAFAQQGPHLQAVVAHMPATDSKSTDVVDTCKAPGRADKGSQLLTPTWT